MHRMDVHWALEQPRKACRSREFADLDQRRDVGSSMMTNHDFRTRHAGKRKESDVEVANFNLPFKTAAQHLQSPSMKPGAREDRRDTRRGDQDHKTYAGKNQPARHGPPLVRDLFHSLLL